MDDLLIVKADTLKSSLISLEAVAFIGTVPMNGNLPDYDQGTRLRVGGAGMVWRCFMRIHCTH